MIGPNLKKLESVGSFLDVDCGLIYPILVSGEPDWGAEVSLYDDEVSSEWMDSLSTDDWVLVEPFLDRAGSQLNK